MPGFWTYGGSPDYHELGTGSTVSEPCTVAALVRLQGTSVIQDALSFTANPYLRIVYSGGQTYYRWNNVGQLGTGEAVGNWHLVVYNYNGGSDQLEEVSTASTGATGAYGTLVNLSTVRLGRVTSSYANIDIAQVVVWSATVAGSDIQSAINAAYPGLL